ncbi:MAG: helix-turn-helix transcriptional regulator, partial [Deltaproteobacteria bacterium]|nr:helix-turn-helix transcriptional regulator [Deltaproteobacteria bacterium]
VRAALRAPDRPPDPTRLARQLRTSPRTLRRELARAGSSYQALADELRRERALSWVRTTNLTIAQISERLGFSDVRAFRRAFGRWTGQTPADYRAAGESGP